MTTHLFWQGLILGFSIAAPVGPIGVLCIRRTLAQGRASGLASGLGAATADAVYGAIAALGLTAISGFLVQQQTLLRGVGGLFLCYLGVRTLLAKPASAPIATAAQGRGKTLSLPGDYFSTFFLTLTNPMTILSFVAIFAGMGLAAGPSGGAGDGAAAVRLVAGVFLGSALWWLTLAALVGFLRQRLTPAHLRLVNVLSGVIIAAFGVITLVGILGGG